MKLKRFSLLTLVGILIILSSVIIYKTITDWNLDKNVISQNQTSNTTKENPQNEIIKNNNNIYNLETIDYNKVLKLKRDDSIYGEYTDGRPWAPLYINNDGLVYGLSGKNEKDEKVLFSYNLETKEFLDIATISNGISIFEIVESSKYIAWIEGIIKADINKSSVQLYNKETGTIETLAQYNYSLKQSNTISISDKSVVWTEFDSQNVNTKYPTLRIYEFASKEKKIYKENASNPAIGKDYIAYLSESKKTPNKAGVFIEKNTGEITELDISESINSIASDNNSLVIATFNGVVKKLYVYENNKLNNILTANNASYNFDVPKISKNFVCWQSMSKTMVYDRNNNSVIMIDDSNDSSKVIISNSYIINVKTLSHTKDGKEQTKSDAMKYDMFYGDIYVKQVSF
ncbi:MAG: hypothetical protein ACRC68_15210 [Clostridium sp.]